MLKGWIREAAIDPLPPDIRKQKEITTQDPDILNQVAKIYPYDKWLKTAIGHYINGEGHFVDDLEKMWKSIGGDPQTDYKEYLEKMKEYFNR